MEGPVCSELEEEVVWLCSGVPGPLVCLSRQPTYMPELAFSPADGCLLCDPDSVMKEGGSFLQKNEYPSLSNLRDMIVI